MSDPSVEPVINALQALYSNPDPAAKEQANAWLSEFQKSVSTLQSQISSNESTASF